MATEYYTDSLAGGPIVTRQVPLVADTYFRGMLLQYNFTVPATGTLVGAGNGTMTLVSQAGMGIPLEIGTYEIECTTTITNGGIFKITNPSGNIIADNLTLKVGDTLLTAFVAGGLNFTITEGSTDFVAGDIFSVAVTADGYAALTDGQLSGIYSETDDRTLSSAGVGSVIVSGEVAERGLVDSSGAALTINEGQRVAWQARGFIMKS